ncbi:hypothetical protein KQH49_12650 [Mycetohabitans sp. B5]|nr:MULTISPECIES: surface-adhesin E family protein [Mycetohabitans]MCG1055729.1 hypothetical protein [Mycetohabitans sp. B5]
MGIGIGIGIAGGSAQAVQWINLSSARELSFELDADSARKNPGGYLVYSTRTTWRDTAQPPGAIGAVAVSIGRSQMDCHAKQWRLLESRYKRGDGSPAGVYKPASDAWIDIGPGTVMEKIYARLC